MRLYYAAGSGWGHLTRALAFLHTLGADYSEWLLLTDSSYSPTLPEGLQVLRLPAQHLRAGEWAEELRRYPIEEVYLDCFPLGIEGEWLSWLQAKSELKFYYIARRLKWAEYLKSLPMSEIRHFERVYRLEELEVAQENWMRENATQIIDFQLIYAELPLDYRLWASARLAHLYPNISQQNRPLWLVVHSQPQEEVDALCFHAAAYAERESIRPRLLLLSNFLPPEELRGQFAWLIGAEARAFFGSAERIFSAAGFNTMQQLKGYEGRLEIMPFFRRFDDQFWRAAKYRK